jgi:hypothetical protein
MSLFLIKIYNINNNASKSNDSMSLILWVNNLSSTAKIKYTKDELSMVKLTKNVRSIIIGIILSDGHLALVNRSENTYLMFSKSLAKLTYVFFVYNFLNHYCQSYPKVSISN